MKQIVNKSYYTFEEIIKLVIDEDATISDYIDTYLSGKKNILSDNVNTDYIAEMLNRFNYYSVMNNCYFTAVDNDKQIYAAFIAFTNKIIDTEAKYSKIITNLIAGKDNLLNSAKSISTSRFNDTPQNSGDFSDDEHTSTYTENTSYLDLDVLSGLNQIDDTISDYYRRWISELRGWMIYE